MTVSIKKIREESGEQIAFWACETLLEKFSIDDLSPELAKEILEYMEEVETDAANPESD